MMNRLLYILLVIPVMAFAQNRQQLHGKVVADDLPVAGVFVINKNTGTEAKTGTDGIFYLDVKAGDGIAVNGNSIDTRNFTVNDKWFNDKPFLLEVEQQAYELEEVVVEGTVNEESLGLVPKGQKQYTHAEKKVFTATTGLFDPIINAISGRTKMLKKAAQTEKKVFIIEEINGLYTEDEIMKNFNIPKEYVNGFIFYIVEDPAFAASIKDKNDTLSRFLMIGLSEKYLKLISDE